MNLGAEIAERFRKYGWDQPIRPSHVPIPPVPRIGYMKEFRAVIAGGLVFMALSTLATLPLHRLFPNPALGIPTVFDALGILLKPLFSFNLTVIPTTRSTAPVEQASLPLWAHGYLTALIVCALPALAAAIAYYARPDKIPKRYLGTTRDNEWSSMNDLVRAGLLDHEKPGIVIGAVKPPSYPFPINLIVRKRPLELIVDANPSHVLLDASSRSGKDVGPIAFTIALYPGSTLTNDNKSEQYALQSGNQRDFYKKNVIRWAFAAPQVGQLVVSPTGKTYEEPWGSSKLNILNDIPWGTDREFSALLQTSSLIVCKDLKMLDDGENGHWYRTARVLHTALCYKVVYDPLETLKSVSRTAMIMAGDEAMDEEARATKAAMATDGAEVDSIHAIIEHYLGMRADGQGSTPAWVRRAADDRRDRLKRMLAMKRAEIGISVSESDYARYEVEQRTATEREIAKLEAALVHPDLQRAVQKTLRIRGDEAGSVYSTLDAQLTPWLDPRVISNTATSDHRLLDWLNHENPTAIFSCNAQDYGSMFRPIYTVTWDLLIRLHLPDMEYDQQSSRVVSPNRHGGIIIPNEPLTLGDIPSLTANLPFLASYGIRFLYPFQMQNQRKELMGENEPISGNTFTHVFHTPSDKNERQELSDLCGVRMILNEDNSGSNLGSVNRSLAPKEVPLISPEQIQSMQNDMLPKKQRDPKTGKIEDVRNADGSLQVGQQAFQIARTRSGVAYLRKIQWFTDEFRGVYRLIKKYKPVKPTRTIIEQIDAKVLHAEQQPTIHTPEEKPVTHQPTITFTPLQRAATSANSQSPTATVVETEAPPITPAGELPPAFRDLLE